MNEMIGTAAGAIWMALSENGAMSAKDLQTDAKTKTDKETDLAMGWLLREDKLNVAEEGKEMTLCLK